MKIKVKSKLGDYLKERGIKQSFVADKIGITRGQFNNWCKNNNDGYANALPSLPYIIRMIKLLKCDIDDIFEEIEWQISLTINLK